MQHIILIPYRNRESHLKYFIDNTVPLLKKHLENLKIVIIEQGNDKLFNRGILFNIGFDLYKDLDAIFFTHDVDVNPNEECIKELYKPTIKNNEIISIYSDSRTLGGIIAFKKETFIKINGFPNNFWGWGIEDRALYNRVVTYNIDIVRNIIFEDVNKTNKLNILNDINDRVRTEDFIFRTEFEYNNFGFLKTQDKLEHILSSGLNNLSYTITNKININDFIEIIKVDF